MPFGKSELQSGIPFKIELDKHRWLFADNAPIVAGLNHDHLRRNKITGAAVLEGHMNVALG